jgi:hypothetical protein
MSLQGPIVVVAHDRMTWLIDVLGSAGAFPIIEARWREVDTAIASIEPAALILADADDLDDPDAVPALAERVAAAHGPYVPIIALTHGGAPAPTPLALPVMHDAPSARLIARLRSALRVRSLHAAALRRAQVLNDQGIAPPEPPDLDPLEDATVLVVGRGRRYPELTVAAGERVGLIGALSLETATRYLNARDLDGVIVGDGFNRSMVESFVLALGNDPRFRDLPVVVCDEIGADIDPERLPNLERVSGNSAHIVAHMLPFARLHALAERLRRMIASFDAKGQVDVESGLLRRDTFMRNLQHALADAERNGTGLAIARFALDNMADRRVSLDAARIIGRLVRSTDFAHRDRDGTVVVAFTETDLGAAHVVARRIVSVLKHTMLMSGRNRPAADPTVALAILKPRDTIDTLFSRVAMDGLVAAG